MAYTKTNWINDSPPALSAENLNKIEEGIYNNSLVIDATDDYIVETGTSGGWSYRKWKSGRMEAEKDVTTGSTWTQVGSAGFYYNATTITPPTGMTVKSGFANLLSVSQYITSAQVQVGTSTTLQVHRLASTSAAFNFRVTLIGTY
jgi:hypothetical protein